MMQCIGKKKTVLSELELKGVIKKSGHGKYLLLDSLDGFHDHMRRGNSQDESGNVIDYNVERARKIKEEADALERKRLIDEKKQIDRDEYSTLISEAIQVQKRELAALPLTLQRMVPGMSAKAIEQITKACARSHNAVLDLQIDAESADQSA